MDCYGFDKIMSDYIDADLSVKQRQEANEHLSVCKRCSSKLADMKNILAKMKTLSITTSPNFESRLMSRIEKSKEQRESRFIRLFQEHSRPISVIAAVFLLFATSIFVYTSVVIPNTSGSLPSAEIRSTTTPANNNMQTPVNVAASVKPALSSNKAGSVVPDSNKVELPDYNQQIMTVNKNK